MSRGLRNCNPGNIRISSTKYLGEVQPSQDSAFKQFSAMQWGYRAMFVLLYTYHRRGLFTLRKMIDRYAPPVENHTENYIDFVATSAGCSADEHLNIFDREVMIPIVAAMSQIENGTPADKTKVTEGWQLFIQHKP